MKRAGAATSERLKKKSAFTFGYILFHVCLILNMLEMMLQTEAAYAFLERSLPYK